MLLLIAGLATEDTGAAAATGVAWRGAGLTDCAGAGAGTEELTAPVRLTVVTLAAGAVTAATAGAAEVVYVVAGLACACGDGETAVA